MFIMQLHETYSVNLHERTWHPLSVERHLCKRFDVSDDAVAPDRLGWHIPLLSWLSQNHLFKVKNNEPAFLQEGYLASPAVNLTHRLT